MGYLVLTRVEGEEIVLRLSSTADPQEVLEQLKEGVSVNIAKIGRGQVKIGIKAPPGIEILRNELLGRERES